MAEYLLCVGGANAGERHSDFHGGQMRLPFMERMTVARFFSNEGPTSTESKYTVYQVAIFSTPEGRVSVWAPAGQSPLKTLELLIDGYERSIAQN